VTKQKAPYQVGRQNNSLIIVLPKPSDASLQTHCRGSQIWKEEA
jgi:hypothetical protein